MASSRNLNSRSDYLCEKKANNDISNYLLDPVYGSQNNNVQMFSLGTGPAKMYSGKLSHNEIDVESKLRGIRSTNLEGPSFEPRLKQKNTKSIELFENHLKNNIYLPNPFVHHSNERVGFHSS